MGPGLCSNDMKAQVLLIALGFHYLIRAALKSNLYTIKLTLFKCTVTCRKFIGPCIHHHI